MARPLRRERRPPDAAAPKAPPSKASPKAPRRDWSLLGLWLLILVPPFVFLTESTDNFRLPKLLWSETLAAIALALLAFRLAKVERVEWAAALGRLRSEPALLALAPLLLVATLSALFTKHPERTSLALGSLWMAAIFLVGLALALRPEERDRLLRLLSWPAALLSLLAIVQFHDLMQPFGFARELTDRLLLTSLAGGAFDLSGYLLLPALFALRELFKAEGRRALIVWGVLAALFVYGMAISQTLTVLIGFLAACPVLAFFCLRRHFWRLAGGLAALAVVLVLVVAPLRGRVEHAARAIADHDYNQLLSGRLDGWRVAGRMLADHPVAGVGHGAFRSEFGGTKIELADEGMQFFLGHRGAYFTNAHNDLLEAGAELGWPGLLAALWGAAIVFRQAFRRKNAGAPADLVGLELATLVAVSLVALANFPFHVALIAYPWLIFLAGVLAPARPAVPAAAQGEEAAA
jgi:O-antigen ligase